MADPQRYPIPRARARAEVVIERSRFICTLAPAESPEAAHAFVREMSHEFDDATHNCSVNCAREKSSPFQSRSS